MKKRNVPLIVGLSIPIGMVLFIAASIHIPRLFNKVHPQYDFVYTVGNYYGQSDYTVVNGKIQKVQIKKDVGIDRTEELRIYKHETRTNTNRELTFDEAQSLKLDSQVLSKDGFEVITNYGNADIFPFIWNSPSSESIFFKRNGFTEKILIQSVSTNVYTYSGFRFIGWIER